MSSESRVETQRVCVTSLKCLAIDEANMYDRPKSADGNRFLQSAIDFHQFFFTHMPPSVRQYFKGAEHYSLDEYAASERVRKLGRRVLLSMHMLANVYAEPPLFRAYTAEVLTRHRRMRIDAPLWTMFWTVWIKFLEFKLNEAQSQEAACSSRVDAEKCRNAWLTLGEEFVRVGSSLLEN